MAADITDIKSSAKELAKELDRLRAKSKDTSDFMIRDFTDLGKEWTKTMELLSVGADRLNEDLGKGYVDASSKLNKTLLKALNSIGRSTFPQLNKQAELFISGLEKMRVQGLEPQFDEMLADMKNALAYAQQIHKELMLPELEAKFKAMIGPLESLADRFGRIPLVGVIFQAKMETAIKHITSQFNTLKQNFDGSAASSASILRGTLGAVWKEIGANIGLIATGLLAIAMVAAVEAIWKRFMGIQETLKKIAENTGVVNEQLVQAEQQIVSSNTRLVQYGVSLEVAGASWQSIFNITGNTAVITQQMQDSVALMAGSLKMSTDEAARAFIQIRAMANASDATTNNIINSIASVSKLAGVGVTPKRILEDMAKSSKFLNIYFRGNVTEMAKAAVEAQRIGLSLEKVGKMTEQLLDWDTSIEDEMNASVMLGRQINFQKA